jgi:NADPH:quinone reductase-like Zn-dependent oxidoreductase
MHSHTRQPPVGSMLVARNTRFGPPGVVRIEHAPIPVPGRGQILVRIRASTVSAADWRLRTRSAPRGFGVLMGLLFGFSRPRYQVLGTELAGEVVDPGHFAARFRPGDRIVANLGMRLGGHAEYAVVDVRAPIARIPDTVSFVDAAALVFGGTTALAFLRDKMRLQRGERLLVIGAGGAVGSAAVQLGRVMGAEVTGVCGADKVGHVSGLGVPHVIDYRAIDWRRDPLRYDLIVDTVGGTHLGNVAHKLTAAGRVGLVVADLPLMLKSMWRALTGPNIVHVGSAADSVQDLEYLLELCAEGEIRPLVGAILPLERIVEAHERVESGHKLGSVVIVMDGGDGGS